jgi:hypothetical protein
VEVADILDSCGDGSGFDLGEAIAAADGSGGHTGGRYFRH